MVAGLARTITLYLAPALALTATILSLLAFLAPAIALPGQVALLAVTPSTVLSQPGPSQVVDGPSVFLGILDLTVLPKNAPGLLLTAPSMAVPAFISISLAFSVMFFFSFTLITFREKFPGKFGAVFSQPAVQRSSALLGFFSFMIGLTNLLILHIWFSKSIRDFNAMILAQDAQRPMLIAEIGNAFTTETNIPHSHLSSTHLTRSKFHRRPLGLLNRAPTNDSRDITIIYERRVSSIVNELGTISNIAAWLRDLDGNGKWPDSQVNYTTGCEARRANWPAQTHWQRILVMAGAWRGGVNRPNAAQWVNSTQLRSATSRAMAYWFSRDMGNNTACLDRGGTPACPCENPGNTLWNTNWFSNIILIPELVSQSCLLLNNTLTATETGYCTRITARTYALSDTNINGVGYLTGANTLDVGKISTDGALLANNPTMLADAYRRIHNELTIRNDIKADGIRADGSFGQHGGVLYNGNYGKDYSNAVLDLEIAAAGTQFAAGSDSRHALETLFDGHKWMIYANSLTQVLHFDISTIGRMITFPVVDNQASGSIQINLTTVLELGRLWASDILTRFATDLLPTSTSANSGNLIGNKFFYTNDYMVSGAILTGKIKHTDFSQVHRGPKYVSTLRMYSKRTSNTECVNTQNPLGFHLSDGTLYTYLQGDEYEDISAAWDWDLIPGTTTDYKNTPLNCSGVSFSGAETFVGGLSDGKSGIAAMRYTNPSTGALQWQKTWFFLESGVQHVMINILASKSKAPVYSVLDQKRRSGRTLIDGVPASNSGSATFTNPKSIWHANVGYSFLNKSVALSLKSGIHAGDWSTIGTSTQSPVEVDLWTAWLEHKNISSPAEYAIWPGITYEEFVQRASQTPVQTFANSASASTIYDRQQNRVMLVLWKQDSSVIVQTSQTMAPLTISSNVACAMTVSLSDGTIFASDPSQSHSSASLTFAFGAGQLPAFWIGNRTKTLTLRFPKDGQAGNSVTAHL
ncbi:hypothetical protein EST38_g2892 [Candolleomyces aberdarensis]|uniref:Polysaccharide lyase family 8 protein n=1 Tax=Candolleomyces aberdarensis TaxID=2316362 RepID=A0A4Q2DSE6_9AGAR|nr:hypothetical protein EST38_g2892 [Candolleomyces aberdarensis]